MHDGPMSFVPSTSVGSKELSAVMTLQSVEYSVPVSGILGDNGKSYLSFADESFIPAILDTGAACIVPAFHRNVTLKGLPSTTLEGMLSSVPYEGVAKDLPQTLALLRSCPVSDTEKAQLLAETTKLTFLDNMLASHRHLLVSKASYLGCLSLHLLLFCETADFLHSKFEDLIFLMTKTLCLVLQNGISRLRLLSQCQEKFQPGLWRYEISQ